MIASLGVFAGSLLADSWLGDGIQATDIQQAAMVGLVAAVIQLLLNRNKS